MYPAVYPTAAPTPAATDTHLMVCAVCADALCLATRTSCLAPKFELFYDMMSSALLYTHLLYRGAFC
jgi:hypothetical protein